MFIYVKGNNCNFCGKNNIGDNMDNKKTKNENINLEIPVNNIVSQPQHSVYELINKYGTYEIQPTSDSDNDFPKIAQGLPKQENRKIVDKDWDGYKNNEK